MPRYILYGLDDNYVMKSTILLCFCLRLVFKLYFSCQEFVSHLVSNKLEKFDALHAAVSRVGHEVTGYYCHNGVPAFDSNLMQLSKFFNKIN